MRCSQIMVQYSAALTTLSTHKCVYCIRIRGGLKPGDAESCDVLRDGAGVSGTGTLACAGLGFRGWAERIKGEGAQPGVAVPRERDRAGVSGTGTLACAGLSFRGWAERIRGESAQPGVAVPRGHESTKGEWHRHSCLCGVGF